MKKVLVYYKNKLKRARTTFKNTVIDMLSNFPDRALYVTNLFKNRLKKLSPALEERRNQKFRRDLFPFDDAINYSKKKILGCNMVCYKYNKLYLHVY